MKPEERESKPAAVPKDATQAGEVRARWAWVEPAVWTDRMLTALESGVKGGKWFSLMDKVYAPRALEAAFARVKANKGAAGVDHQTVATFGRKAEENLERPSLELRSGKYVPLPARRVWIPKPGSAEKRPLGIPTVRELDERLLCRGRAVLHENGPCHGQSILSEVNHRLESRMRENRGSEGGGA